MAHKDLTLDLEKHPFGPAVLLIIRALRESLRSFISDHPGVGGENDSANLTFLLYCPHQFSWKTVAQARETFHRLTVPDRPSAAHRQLLAAVDSIPELLDISSDDSTLHLASMRVIGLINDVFPKVEKKGLVSFGETGFTFTETVGEGIYEQVETFTLLGLTRDDSTDGRIEITAEGSDGQETTFPLEEIGFDVLAEAWDRLQEKTPIGD